jgi:hypothetical protein
MYYETLRNKVKKTLKEGKTSHIHGSAELLLLKWPYNKERFNKVLIKSMKFLT